MSAGQALQTAMRQGLETLGLGLSPVQQQQLLDYLSLIGKWNKVYNLTALREPAEMLTHHLLDSLAVVPALRRQWTLHSGSSLLQGARLLDVGSGAGLPGVVFAICCPELVVHCVDAVAKKAAFLQQVALTLNLPLLQGVHARVEDVKDRYQVISCRAFASLADFTQGSARLLDEGGVWLAMKGKLPQAEISALPPVVQVLHVEQLQVPGLAAERCVVWMRRRQGVEIRAASSASPSAAA